MTTATRIQISQDWAAANRQYLNGELLRLRLLLRRRVLWLRRQWASDCAENYQGLVITEAQANRLLACEDQRAEERFYVEDPEALAISQSIAEMDLEIAGQEQALQQAGTPPATDVLVHLFGLSSFERDVLLLCMAPELDPAFERLYAYVQDDATRKYATPHLAVTLFGAGGEGWHAARASFLKESPLRRFRLLTMGSGSPPAETMGACPLRLDERILGYLLGVNRLDERVARLLLQMPPALLPPDHSDLVSRLEQSVKPDTKGAGWPALNLIGPPQAGKRAVARALCERIGLLLYRLDVDRLPAAGQECQEMLRLLEREGVLLQFALYVDLSRIEDATELGPRTSVREVIEQLGLLLFLGSRERYQTERETVGVRLKKLDAGRKRALWQQALAGEQHEFNSEIEGLVQQFDIGPTAIYQSVAEAKSQLRLRTADDGANLSAGDLWQACRTQTGWHLEGLAQRLSPNYTWKDIVLPDDVYNQLREIAAQVANRSRVYETWGFGEKLSRGRGISALFAGPSGTGKTMAAEILANHLKLDLFRIDLAGVVSKYIGETEKNLRRVFDAAEQSGAILFFDEADALFGKRSEVKDSHDRYANIEISYLLQRMEDYRGLAILATNMKSHMDQAFLRRLRFLVDFPFPDSNYRLLIWKTVFPAEANVEGLDYSSLARLEIPGGSIKNIALNAAFLASAEGKLIRMEHILNAARREYSKIGKLVLQSEFGTYYEMMKQ